MKNIFSITNQTLQIIKAGSYNIGEKTIELIPGNYSEVKVYTPKMADEIMNRNFHDCDSVGCNFYLVNDDSYQAARNYDNPLVMNFANAYKPGGAFLEGATSQEETLCRNSTLYASISSDKANEMYEYNLKHLSPVDSDYMLLSPEVCVFRDMDCELLESPYMVSVITLPAPNKRGEAMYTNQKALDMVMKKRIRIMLKIAAENKYKTLILGAWGCGAFGHDARTVAEYFKEVLINEQYEKYFENVVFAVLGYKYKLDAFAEVFKQLLMCKKSSRRLSKKRTQFARLWQWIGKK